MAHSHKKGSLWKKGRYLTNQEKEEEEEGYRGLEDKEEVIASFSSSFPYLTGHHQIIKSPSSSLDIKGGRPVDTFLFVYKSTASLLQFLFCPRRKRKHMLPRESFPLLFLYDSFPPFRCLKRTYDSRNGPRAGRLTGQRRVSPPPPLATNRVQILESKGAEVLAKVITAVFQSDGFPIDGCRHR